MEFLGLSNVITLIEKIGLFQTIFLIVLLSVVYIVSRLWLKRIDSTYENLKIDNQKLKDQISELRTQHDTKLTSIEQEIKKKIGQRTNFMKNHPFFSTMDYLIDVKIPSILFKSQFKRVVFTDILTYLVRASQVVFKDFVANDSNFDTGHLEFRNNITKAMNQCHQRFVSDCEGSMIPREVMDSFHVWASPLTRFLFSATDNICQSKMYETNVDKTNTLLSINLAIYDEMISNIELYLEELNGDFVGLVYKGIKCEEEEHAHKN